MHLNTREVVNAAFEERHYLGLAYVLVITSSIGEVIPLLLVLR